LLPDPRDRALTDLLARVRQIERRSAAKGIVAAKVSKPVTNVTNTTEEITEVTNNITNVVNKSCSARNTSPVWGWSMPGDIQAMEWTALRTDASFTIGTGGITVVEGGWHRVTATVYAEASGAAYVSGVFTVNGVATGGRFRLDMDNAVYDSGGAFYDSAGRVAELDLDDGDEVGVELRLEDASTGFVTPGSTSVLVVEKI
jgi:hypothetical protein